MTDPLTPDVVPDGYVPDYISGIPVRATPEEVESVQIFARRLVEDFGYPKNQIQTRPQYRVRQSPSDSKKSYPVDIAVFSDSSKADDKLTIVVECKKKRRHDGRRQLELYLNMSHADVGAWFNGEEHLYLHKIVTADKRVDFDELPTLPRCGQRVEDIGLFKRHNLVSTSALRPVFRDIRNHLAGNLTGITRDETLAQQIIDILLCKIFDELDKGPDEYVQFRAGVGESADDVHARLLDLFAAVKKRYSDVFPGPESIEIDPTNIKYVVGELQNYCITEASRDAIGDAFEVFIGPALRGTEGQFFTPRNVVQMMVDILNPKPHERIIDPACGSGGFLIVALEHVWRQVEQAGAKKKWDPARIAEERRYVASQFFKGIEKDRFLAKVTKSYMAIVGDGRAGIHLENSLAPPKAWDPVARSDIQLGRFDVVVTNPPFGTKIPIRGRETLSQYQLAHHFVRVDDDTFELTGSLMDSQPPQLLFIERCLQLLQPGGRMGIVLPESLFGMPKYRSVSQWLRRRCRVMGIVSMPEDLFQPHTHAKTCVVFVKNEPPRPDDEIFMSVVEWCGHDSRGNPTIRRAADGSEELLDDIPRVAKQFHALVGEDW